MKDYTKLSNMAVVLEQVKFIVNGGGLSKELSNKLRNKLPELTQEFAQEVLTVMANTEPKPDLKEIAARVREEKEKIATTTKPQQKGPQLPKTNSAKVENKMVVIEQKVDEVEPVKVVEQVEQPVRKMKRASA